MIAFMMKVLKEIRYRTPQRLLSEQDQSRHPSFTERTQRSA
jgi:hypothetical protein